MRNDDISGPVADLDPCPDPPAYDPDAERRLLLQLRAREQGSPRRRPVGRAIGAASLGACGVAAAVVVGVLAGASPKDVSSPARGHRATLPQGALPQAALPHTTPPHIRLVADRVDAALSSAQDVILRSDETLTNATGTYRDTFWADNRETTDVRDLTYAADGTPSLDTSTYDQDGTITDLTVDYTQHQYNLTTLTQAEQATRLAARLAEKKAAAGGSGTSGASAASRRPAAREVTAAGQLRADLAAGHDRLVGRTRLHGRDALILANDEPGMNRRIWVDATTDLPIRMTAHGAWGGYTIDYTWIARTPATLAATFAPQPPAGFTKVDQTPTGG